MLNATFWVIFKQCAWRDRHNNAQRWSTSWRNGRIYHKEVTFCRSCGFICHPVSSRVIWSPWCNHHKQWDTKKIAQFRSPWKINQKSISVMKQVWFFLLRALKSPQKFRSPGCSSANFLGSWYISGLKSKSYYEIWTSWLILCKKSVWISQCHF